ncbi:hypothetical protein BJY01DRAFT_208297 [Aspergillus pseudoustus]|uniref:Uncharacterized protein n=1 Tax=Aspergillus pseudoustus TaxID=1810923 RepID=A0ABR4KMC6_9EURO
MPSSKDQHRRRTHHPPPLFWDKLTTLWLTKSALREANRRNNPLSSNRGSFSSPHTSAPAFLRNCSATCLHTRSTNNDDRHTDYVMTQVRHYSLIGSLESYQQSLTAYRNARDRAEELRGDIIWQASERYSAEQDHISNSDGSKEVGQLSRFNLR